MLKVIFLSFVVVSTFQAYFVESKPKSITPFLFDELIEKLVELIESAIKKLKEIVNKAIAEIIEVGKKLLKNAVDELMKKVEELRAKVEKFIEEAKELGIDITECVHENEEKLAQIPTDLRLDCTKCVNDLAAEANAIFQVAQKEIKDFLTEVEKLKKQWSECNNDIICNAKVIKAAEELIVKLTHSGEAIVEMVAQFVQDVGQKLPKCIQDALDKALLRMRDLTIELEECVIDKLQQT